eukprot:7298121-Pyramimonas_sp.AAC.1
MRARMRREEPEKVATGEFTSERTLERSKRAAGGAPATGGPRAAAPGGEGGGAGGNDGKGVNTKKT